MSLWMIVVVTFCYAWTGITQALAGSWWWAGVWLAYAVANACFIGMGNAIH